MFQSGAIDSISPGWAGMADQIVITEKTSQAKDVRAAVGPEVLRVLREDAERLCELTDRRFAHWSIWDA